MDGLVSPHFEASCRWAARVGLAGLVLTGLLARGADAQESAVLELGEPVLGEIADGDAVVETERLLAVPVEAPAVGRRYRFEVGQSGTYRIELRSYVFNAYLVVRNAQGQVVGEDDDGLVGTQSRVLLKASQGDSFTVEACARYGQRGPFELSVSEGEPADVDPRLGQAMALEDARKSVEMREAILGPDHPDLATSLERLAQLLREQRDVAGARPLYERALAIRERALGPEHPDVASSLNSLSSLLWVQHDYAGARPLLSRALAIYEKALGPEDPKVATCLNNLARMLLDQLDYAGAQPLAERALAIRENVLGPEHPDVANSLSNLAQLRKAQGDLAGARPLYERALAIREKALGPGHPLLVSSLNNLAVVLLDQGDPAGARPLVERALAISEKTWGPEHPGVATCLTNLAGVLMAQGDYAGARPLYERALAILEHALGPEHPDVAQNLSILGALLREQGDLAGARPLFERALAISEKALGPEHPDVARSLGYLAGLLMAQGDRAGARPLFERALAIWEKVLPPEHPGVASSLNNLAGLLRAQGDDAGARALLQRALAIREKALGPEHPEVAISLNNLATLLLDEGDHADARPLLERALAIWERALGSEHPWVTNGLNSLALVKLDLGDVAAAVGLARRAAAGQATGLAAFLSGSTESDSMRYVAATNWHIEMLQSPDVVSQDPLFSYESLLAWKGQVLRAARTSRAVLRQAIGPEGRDLADRLHRLSSELSRSASGIGRGDAPGDAVSVQALSQEYQRVQRELAPRVAGLLPEARGWDELRQALPPQAALVDLFVHRCYTPARRDGDTFVEKSTWTEPRVSAWITRGDAVTPVHVDLGPVAGLEALLHATLQAATSARGEPLAKWPEPGPELRRLLWDPLAPELEGIDMVIVSPDGLLATLPFEVLRGDDDRYLVEARAFVYLTDPTDIVRRSSRAAVAPRALLAVGGVDYEHGEHKAPAPEPAPGAASAPTAAAAESPPLPRGGWTAAWSPLPATATEVSRVVAVHRAAFVEAHDTVLTGAAATEEALKMALPDFGVLHLATHGYFNPEGLPSLEAAAQAEVDRPRDADGLPVESFAEVAARLQGYSPGLLSGLVCSGANANPQPPRDDGYLTAEEVGWLDLGGVDLVVLSACDTGLGRPQSGEGLLGLRRAFLAAGARTVISSLWAVPDQETVELMDLLYRNLWERKLSGHEALRAAQLEMIRRNRERFDGDARPATWGAFVLDGDWR